MADHKAPPPARYQSTVARRPSSIGQARAPLGSEVARNIPQIANCRIIEYNFAQRLTLPANVARVYLFIINLSTTDLLYISFAGGSAGPLTGFPLVVATTGAYGYFEPLVVPINQIALAGSGYVAEGSLNG